MPINYLSGDKDRTQTNVSIEDQIDSKSRGGRRAEEPLSSPVGQRSEIGAHGYEIILLIFGWDQKAKKGPRWLAWKKEQVF